MLGFVTVTLLATSLGAQQEQPSLADLSGFAWHAAVMRLAENDSARTQREAEQRLAKAVAEGARLDEAYALLALSYARGRQNDMRSAMRHCVAARGLAEKLGDERLLLTTLRTAAVTFEGVSDFASAIDTALRALPLAERAGDSADRVMLHSVLSECHARLGDVGRAAEFAVRALALAEEAGEPRRIAYAKERMAETYLLIGDLATARQHFTELLQLRRGLGSRTASDDVRESLAMIDFREGRATEALTALTAIERRRRFLRGRHKLSVTLLHRSEVLLALDRPAEALEAIKEAFTYVDVSEASGTEASICRQLAAVHERRGEFAEALAAARRQFEIEQRISGEAARSRAEELQVRFDVARKDQELARLARDKEVADADARARAAQLSLATAELRAAEATLGRTRWQRLALSGGVVGTALVLGAVALVLRARLRAERRIVEETRAARDAAQAADALKGRLLAFASHDLKAPLSSLGAAAYLIDSEPGATPGMRALASTLRAETARMTQLVQDFLDRAALDDGRLTLRSAPLNLADVVEQAVSDFRALAEQKEQTLTLEPPVVPLPPVSGEAARLRQVLANLISNAIKFSPRGGAIRVVIGSDESGVWCEVRDSGPGLAPAELARLFQPYSRLSATPTGGESSSGLGLHLARELVSLHGGSLQVDSQPGQGAAFRFTLAPLAIGAI